MYRIQNYGFPQSHVSLAIAVFKLSAVDISEKVVRI